MKKKHYYKTGVDICSTKSMFEFINGHFKYYTMHSWNKLKSVANDVKVYNLGLEGDYVTAMSFLEDEGDCGGLQSEIVDRISEWEESHPGYALRFNGRSGGYLVMYNKEKDGSINFRSALPEWLDDFDDYGDWKEGVTDPWYGRAGKVSDCVLDLREYTELIRSFDRLCDDLRDLVNEYSKMDFDAQKKAAEAEG